jgi:hypothetical protein
MYPSEHQGALACCFQESPKQRLAPLQNSRQILAIRKLARLLHLDLFPDPPGTIPWELGRIR